jgi:hypothetical protein
MIKETEKNGRINERFKAYLPVRGTDYGAGRTDRDGDGLGSEKP